MKVRLVRSGGVAGVRLATEADCEKLPDARARSLARLVEQSGILSLPTGAPGSRPAPDRFAYRVTVETDAGEHTVEVAEDDVTPALEPLIDWLVAHARDATA